MCKNECVAFLLEREKKEVVNVVLLINNQCVLECAKMNV